MRSGRPIKTYTASYDSKLHVPGLSRTPDNRWRVFIDGKEMRFTEPDERRAIERAKQLLGIDDHRTTAIEVKLGDLIPDLPPSMDGLTDSQVELLLKLYDDERASDEPVAKSLDELPYRFDIPDSVLWPWLRKFITEDPVGFAAKIGIPELAGWRHLGLPTASMKLATISDAYRQSSASGDKAKQEALAPFNRLIASTGAKTLDDLTTEKLLAFREEIESDPHLKSAGTRRGYYGRIRTIIAFGMKVGLDAKQIREALDRAKVLWTKAPMPDVDPKPISPEHLTTLLKASDFTWQKWILLGLNLCLHIEEVCGLQWSEFDLAKRTYASIRTKTRRRRIPRAATLWPETQRMLSETPHRGRSPFVFTSTHGTRYNKNTRVSDFAELRDGAGLPKDTTFDTLRDGAYTAACHRSPDERQARVLAGHKAHGWTDNYVLRNPEIVKPACDAVYATYKHAILAGLAAEGDVKG